MATVGGTVGDGNGDGASLEGSFTAKVNSTPIITIPLAATIDPYAIGAIETDPAGGGGTASTASTGVSANGGDSLGQTISFTLSEGDDMAVLAMATLSGSSPGTEPFQLLDGILAQNTTAGPQDYLFNFGIEITGGAYDTLTVGLLGALLDGGEDGASVTNLALTTSLNSIEVTNVGLTGLAVSTLPDLFGVSTAGGAFGQPTLGGVGAPASGTMSIELNFDLGAGDTASLLSRFDLFNSQPVPEPGTATLMVLGLALLVGPWARKRRG